MTAATQAPWLGTGWGHPPIGLVGDTHQLNVGYFGHRYFGTPTNSTAGGMVWFGTPTNLVRDTH
ncbi:hypothetical protein SCOR_30585 [Sulfidibacter corallicola]